MTLFNNLGDVGIGDFGIGDFDLGDFDLGDFDLGDYDLGDFNLGDFDLTPPGYYLLFWRSRFMLSNWRIHIFCTLNVHFQILGTAHSRPWCY